MNKKQYISKLSIFYFLMFFAFFSCDNEKEVKNDTSIVPFELKIDSVNAYKFANRFIENIYNSDSIIARGKFQFSIKKDLISVKDAIALQNVLTEFDLYTQLNNVVIQGGELKLSEYKNENNIHHLIFSLFIPPLEIDYYELTIEVIEDEIVIVDYLSYMQGVQASEIGNEMLNAIFIDEKITIDELSISIQYLDSTRMAFEAYNPELAEWYFLKIDPSVRELKLIDIPKFNLELHSSSMKSSALQNKVKEIDKNTPSYWLYAFYLNVEIENFAGARLSLMNLGERVGNDAVLTYLEGTTFFEERNYEQALELYNFALQIEPSIPNIHFAKVVCLIEMKEYVQAVESLLVMEDFFEVNNTNWDKEFMAYPEFLISDEYSQWLDRIGEIEEETLL